MTNGILAEERQDLSVPLKDLSDDSSVEDKPKAEETGGRLRP